MQPVLWLYITLSMIGGVIVPLMLALLSRHFIRGDRTRAELMAAIHSLADDIKGVDKKLDDHMSWHIGWKQGRQKGVDDAERL